MKNLERKLSAETKGFFRRLLFFIGFCFSMPSFAETPALTSDQGKIVQHVEIRGNSKIEEVAIRLKLNSLKNEQTGHKISEAGQPLDAKVVRDEIQALWSMNEFDDIRVEVKDAPEGKVDLIFIVKEKPTIRKITYQGNKEIKTEDIEKELSLKAGVLYKPELVREKAGKIRQMYNELGFPLTEVFPEVVPAKDSTVELTFKIEEHAKAQIRQIHFIGNKHFTEEKLKDEALTYTHEDYRWSDFLDFFRGRAAPSGLYRQDAFEQSLNQLIAFYAEHGYMQARTGKPQISVSADKRFIYITVPITEGEQYTIGSIDVDLDAADASPIAKKDLLALVKIKSGEIFNRKPLMETIQIFDKKFKEAGYAFVQVEPSGEKTKIHEENKTVDLVISVKPGKPVHIGRIQIKNNEKTRDKVIRRELDIAEGDLYNQTLLDRSREKLIRLSYFERVNFVLQKSDQADDRIDLVIDITEKATGSINFGLGFSTAQLLIINGMLSQRNFLGWGSQLDFSASIAPIGSYQQQLFTLRYYDPRFLDSKVGLGIELYRNYQTFPNAAFLKKIWGGRITAGYQVNDNFSIRGSYRLDWVDIDTFAQDLRDTVLGSRLYTPGRFTSALKFDLDYYNVDDFILPSKGMGDSQLGMRHNFSIEVADQYIGSQINYVKLEGALRFYRPIWGPFTFRFLLAGGLILSRSPNGVPIAERYYNSQGYLFENRGFNPNTMGPRVSLPSGDLPGTLQQTSIGANYFLRATAEIEFPLLPEKYNTLGFKGVVFLDVGNGYNVESKGKDTISYCGLGAGSPSVFSPCESYPTFQNLRYSLGFGIHWNKSPLGAPLRFEFGFPLNRQTTGPFSESVFYFTFGMGSSF